MGHKMNVVKLMNNNDGSEEDTDSEDENDDVLSGSCPKHSSREKVWVSFCVLLPLSIPRASIHKAS